MKEHLYSRNGRCLPFRLYFSPRDRYGALMSKRVEEYLVEHFEESTGVLSKRLEGQSIAGAKKNRKGDVVLTMSDGSRFHLTGKTSCCAWTEAVAFVLCADSVDHVVTRVTVDVKQGTARFFVLSDMAQVMMIDADVGRGHGVLRDGLRPAGDLVNPRVYFSSLTG